MLQWSSNKAFTVLLLLFLSAFASASETAFFSLNRFQLRRLKERSKSAYERIRTLLARPSRLLVLILVINEVVNITISSLITEFLQINEPVFAYYFPWIEANNADYRRWLFITITSMLITLPLLILFGEITPKVMASKMNRFFAAIHSKILIFFYRLFYPLLWIVDSAISSILRRFKAEGRDHITKTMSILSEEDFLTLMEEGHREGTVNPNERKLIKNVLEFDDNTVGEVITPLSQIFMVSADAKISEVLPEMLLQKYSRIPVYEKSKKNVIGIMYTKDMLDLPHDKPELKEIPVRTFVSEAIFVNPEMKLPMLFRKFKTSKTHIAVCIAPNQEALGIISMEDVLESIFGEIEDERDVR